LVLAFSVVINIFALNGNSKEGGGEVEDADYEI